MDFDLDGIETVLQFDGKVEYGRYVPEGKTAADVAWEEKRREDRIRGTVRQVVRITWADRDHPELVDRMLRDAAVRARRPDRAPLITSERGRALCTRGVKTPPDPRGGGRIGHREYGRNRTSYPKK